MPAVPPLIEKPWRMYEGDDTEMTVVVTDDGDPVDLTVYGQWRANWKSAPPFDIRMELIADSSLADTGIVKVRASAVMTASMHNFGWFDLEATHIVSGAVRTFVRGKTLLIKEA